MPSIYHITHISNLPGILARGGLICDRTAQDLKLVNIGHNNIKERRLRKPVPVGPGGTVGDYVPFYFAPLSPMLYAIFKNKVAGYTAGQQPVITSARQLKLSMLPSADGFSRKGTPLWTSLISLMTLKISEGSTGL